MSEYNIIKTGYTFKISDKKHYLKFAKNIYTQFGEDGIIEELFKDLGITGGVVIEFGAWDGIYLSNTYNLWRHNENFKSILIEGDRLKYNEMVRFLNRFNNVECINEFVNYDKTDPNSLDNILSKSKFNLNNIALISIDVDSSEYYILESMSKYLPKVLIIEAGIGDVYDFDFKSYDKGCSLKSITELAISKGYELVCHTGNAIFIKRELMNLVPKSDYSIKNLFCPAKPDIDYLAMIKPDGTLMDDYYFKSYICNNIVQREKEMCLKLDK